MVVEWDNAKYNSGTSKKYQKKKLIVMETCDNNGINKRNRMRYNLTIILEI